MIESGAPPPCERCEQERHYLVVLVRVPLGSEAHQGLSHMAHCPCRCHAGQECPCGAVL